MSKQSHCCTDVPGTLSAGSDASVASTSKVTASAGPKTARARVSATEPPSRSASPAASGRAGSVKASSSRGGRKSGPTSQSKAAPTPIVYPVFIPQQKGKLPEDRREPPLPPIMDSPWYVPKKRKEKVKAVDTASDSGLSEYESSEDEEEAKKRVTRSVALHRPRRGANDMVVWDVTTFWE